MRLRMVVAPDDKLRQVSDPVVIGDEGDKQMLHQVLDSMVETCRHMKGVGLSGIQVGVPSRIFVIVTEDSAMYFINPEIVEVSKNIVPLHEGCLSFPGVYGTVERPETVKLKYLNYDLQECETELTGISARCALHEIDHLDGKLFIDYLGSMARDIALRKSNKAKKAINRLILQQAAAGEDFLKEHSAGVE